MSKIPEMIIILDIAVTSGNLYLRRHAVLLHQRLLGQVNHDGVVRGQRNREPSCEEHGEGVPVVVQEQGVVGQRAHAQTNLG